MTALSGPTLCTCERLSRDGRAWLPRRGVAMMPIMFLLRLSPKVAKNLIGALAVRERWHSRHAVYSDAFVPSVSIITGLWRFLLSYLGSYRKRCKTGRESRNL